MALRRISGLAVALVLLLTLSTLGAAATPVKTGEVTGTAVPCGGLAYEPTAHLEVYRGARLVATKAVPTGRRFRFVVHPGRYVISNEGHPDGSPAFTVRPGRTTHVRVFNYCM